MGARRCEVRLAVQLRGLPDDDRLARMGEAIAQAVAGRLRLADRVIAAREGWPAWTKVVAEPQISFSGLPLDEDLRRRVLAVVRDAIARALAGTAAQARVAAGPSIQLAQYKPPPAPAGDGLHFGPGGEDVFWRTYREQLFIRIDNDRDRLQRKQAIDTVLQGIRRARAQALIREALDRPLSGVRLAMIDALEHIAHDRTLAWELLLYGLERPGDAYGHGPFVRLLDHDPDAIIPFLEQMLDKGDEPYRTMAGRVVRHYLEGQYAPVQRQRRATRERLRMLAARHGLYARGPLGVDAARDRIVEGIDILRDSIRSIVDPLTPAAPRETPQTSDEHTLDRLPLALLALRVLLPTLPPERIVELDGRMAAALQMALLLPDRIGTIQGQIRALAGFLPNDTVPSDEITVLQRLRRRYLAAFAGALDSASAAADFSAAEATFADLRHDVAQVKFDRLRGEFDEARKAVDFGRAFHRSGGVDDPAFAVMSDLLGAYTRAFIGLFVPHGVPGSAFPVTIRYSPESLQSATQVEIDLALYRVLGSMFLLFSAALAYEHDMVADSVWTAGWRAERSRELRAVRATIIGFWNHEDYKGWLTAEPRTRAELEDIALRIEQGRRRERNLRTAILLAATLAAGVAGVVTRAALVGTLLETAAGATRLSLIVTVAEATAFTATQVGLERLAFGKPVTLGGTATAFFSNLVQSAAFGTVARLLGPLGTSGRTWLQFVGRHAAGLALQVDIAALTLAIQGRGFPSDVGHFLVETLGAYVIGATSSHIGGRMQNQAIQARANELAQQGAGILRRANEAARTGRFDEAAFERARLDTLAWLRKIELLHQFMRDTGAMTAAEHDAALEIIDDYTGRIGAAKWRPAATYTGPLLLEAGQVAGLVKVGAAPLYRYDPQKPPPQLATLARSYQRVGSLSTTFRNGTLTVREPGSGRLVLLVGPGPVPAGLLPPPPQGVPAPRPLTFLESAAGGPLTPAGQAAVTALLDQINRDAIPLLQARGDAGLAALSLLVAHRTTLSRWPYAALRGLATALELPRGITRASLERFFATRPNDELVRLFDDFGTIADLPGANLVFRHERALQLIALYRRLYGDRFQLPEGMNDSAQRGLLRMLTDLGYDGLTERLRGLAVAGRLAEFIRNDPLAAAPPVLPEAQRILAAHTGELRPGIHLAAPTRTPAQVRAQIEQFAEAHGASFDAHVPARIEATIATYRTHLRNVQEGIETDGRNVDGLREEFKALMVLLEDGARVLSFSRMLGKGASDPFQAQIDVGWHPLRGRITVLHAPVAAPVQIDVLAHKIEYGFVIEEITASHLGLPVPLRQLASATGPVTIDHALLGDTLLHRKWKQILKYIALQEFGEALGRSWGGYQPVQITVRYRSASPEARAALDRLGIRHGPITP